MSTVQTKLTLATFGAMCLLAVIWGGSFLSNHVALTGVGPLTLVAFRMTLAALTLWLAAGLLGWRVPRSLALWRDFTLMGLFNNVLPFALISWGQKTVPSGLAAILNSLTAVFGVLIAAMVFADERLTWNRLVGVIFGVVGAAVAIGLSNLTALDLGAVSQLAIIGAAVCYGLSGAFARARFKGVAPKLSALGMTTCSAVMSTVWAVSVEGSPSFAYTFPVWAGLVYLGIVATALAYMILYWVIPRAGAGNTGMVTLMVAPIAITLGAVFAQESLPHRAYAGFGLIALGLLILDGRLFRRT